MSQSLTESQISMWKAVIALVDADDVIHKDEIEFLKKRFSNLPASEGQKKELLSQLENPGSVEKHFVSITEPRDRSQFIYYARLLFWSDGDFANQEQKILSHLNEKIMSRVDLEKAMHEMDEIVEKFDAWEQKRRDEQPLHRKVINAIVFWYDIDSLD